MTGQRGSWPGGSGDPLVTRAAEPDWTAMAERHQEELRRRKHLRVAAAGAVATAAIGGLAVLVVPGGSGGGPARPAAAAGSTGASAVAPAPVGGPPSGSAEPSPASTGDPASASPSATGATPGSAQASAGSGRPTAPATKAPPGGASSPTPAPSATPTPEKSQTSTPPPGKPYTPVQVCGSGFAVIDSHSLGAATVYLLYKGATGDNCVTTIAGSPSGPVPMNATLAVKGGTSTGNPGSFTYYAGPIIKRAPDTCVQWGGSFGGTSWTSGWTHCG
ncbi:hypothetical protein [Kitasatospora terrestris]|uniref:hypothetical protein n=1 Tax=Kitasatospora terrestris TaxID=258051 RepID=UPI0031E827B0